MLEDKVVKTIEKNSLIEENDKLLVAVSGGPDSMCILNILNDVKDTLKIYIEVAHLNHQLRVEADEDASYIKDYCESNNIILNIEKVDISKKAEVDKIGIEEAGRNARYDYFEQLAIKKKFDKIVIAHNKNDVAETVLMNILRGTGKNGLKAIQMCNQKYIRPLLNIDREEIEEYCIKQKLNPIIDKSNFENIYTRNKIRNEVIPLIKKEFNPNIIESLYRLADIICAENEYIDKQVDTIYYQVLDNDTEKDKIILDVKIFNLQELVIKRKLILLVVKELFGSTKNIEKIHIDDAVKLIGNNVGNKYFMPNKNLKIGINKGKIEFIKI